MPAAYAHYRFGKLLLSSLPASERQCIQRFRRMFDMGLQGPDFFFYYNPLMKTATGELGKKFHAMTGQEFFPSACAAANSEAARAYLYGLLGHYCLDSVCHPYVQKIAAIGEAAHVALESEFDRYLMTLDGLPSPHTQDLSPRCKLTRGECMTVAAFYPPATGANISQGVRLMALFLKFLSNPKRSRTEAILKCFCPNHLDQLIPETEQEALSLYVRELKELFDQALSRYPGLLSQLTDTIKTGEPLGEDFAPAFG